MDLLEKIEAALDTVDTEVLGEIFGDIDIDDSEDGVLTIECRRDHPMSGYNDRFEFLDVVLIVKEVDGKFILEDKSKRGSGELGKYVARQIENGDMDFPSVEDYDDFDVEYEDAGSDPQTFDTIEALVEEIDLCVDFQG